MIPTGLYKLDKFLHGGIPDGVIVDIFGANSTGKTQLLLQILANSIKQGGHVLYIDTTGGFRPERLLEIQEQSCEFTNPLEMITVSRVTNTFEQTKSILNITNGNFSLIVIDNITDLFSYEYQKKESISKKNSLFMKYMSALSRFSIEQRTPIVISNMIRTSQEGHEIENMKGAIDPFTHIKIHLFKNIRQEFESEVYWALDRERFAYKITSNGLTDS